MTDKENVAEIIPKKLSFSSTISDHRSRSTSNADNIAVSFHGSVASVGSFINNDTVETNEELPLFPNRKIYKNLAILSASLVILFTAYVSVISLQSSLNTKGNVGINALIVMNSFILVSSTYSSKRHFLPLVWFTFPHQCCHGYLRTKMDSYYRYYCLYLLHRCQCSTHSSFDVHLYVLD